MINGFPTADETLRPPTDSMSCAELLGFEAKPSRLKQALETGRLVHNSGWISAESMDGYIARRGSSGALSSPLISALVAFRLGYSAWVSGMNTLHARELNVRGVRRKRFVLYDSEFGLPLPVLPRPDFTRWECFAPQEILRLPCNISHYTFARALEQDNFPVRPDGWIDFGMFKMYCQHNAKYMNFRFGGAITHFDEYFKSVSRMSDKARRAEFDKQDAKLKPYITFACQQHLAHHFFDRRLMWCGLPRPVRIRPKGEALSCAELISLANFRPLFLSRAIIRRELKINDNTGWVFAHNVREWVWSKSKNHPTTLHKSLANLEDELKGGYMHNIRRQEAYERNRRTESELSA